MRKPASSLAKVDYSSAYLEQTHAFGELIRNVDQSTPVPTCPGWSLGQLFRHVGRGDRWAAQIVRDRLDHFLDPRSVEGGKPPPDPDDAISWLYGGARLLVDAVEQTGVETPVWTFLGPRPAGWWVRRRLHEVAVHRADVAITVGGEFTLEPNVAADGISEFLERIAVQAGSGGTPLPLEDDDTLHLHATDPGLLEAGRMDGSSRRARRHLVASARKGCRGTAWRRHRAAAGDGAPTLGCRHRHRAVGGCRGMAKMAGSHAAVAAAHGNFQTMTTSEIATVLAWHDALNAADIETLVALSTDDIDIGDAHGAVQGHDALRGWASSLTTTAELGRMYVHHGVVVVEQKITSGEDPGIARTGAAAFRVVQDHVASVFRHEDLASALAATELTEDDLVD